MKKLILCSIPLVAALLVGCDQHVPSDSSGYVPLPAIQGSTAVPTTASVTNAAVPAMGPLGAASRRNPPHGQPGHRCDIAEGAPLPVSGGASLATLPSATAPNLKLFANQPLQLNNNQASNSAIPATAATPAATAASTATGLNPKHGEPGHRCDIAVGAPLNAAPAKPAQPGTNTTLTSTTTAPASSSNTTAFIPADGLNPKHGQPGHRCDIAVGAPLNGPTKSAATTPTTNTPTTTATPVTVNPLAPLASDTSANTNFSPATSPASVAKPAAAAAPADGLNPKHGQPGHRCDIAVGAPLNSKDKQ